MKYKYTIPAVISTSYLIPLTPALATPTCSELGYNMATTDCSSAHVKCPFDLSKVYCIEKTIPKTCADYGYIKTQPVGQYCTSVSVDGVDCFTDCKTDTCERYGYYSALPRGKTCEQKTINSLNCYYNCSSNSCVAAGYLDNEPYGKSCSSISLDDGTTCYDADRCSSKPATCSEGGYTTAPKDGYQCSTITLYNGTACYSCTTSNQTQCEQQYSAYVWNRCGSGCISGATNVYDDRIPQSCRIPSLLSCDCLGSWI